MYMYVYMQRLLLVAVAVAADPACVEVVPFPGAASIPHQGVCPASELECPECPAETRIRCPQGDCRADVHACTPNVFVRGSCDNATCTGVEYCHLHAGTLHACWEVAPSAATASMEFTDLRTNE